MAWRKRLRRSALIASAAAVAAAAVASAAQTSTLAFVRTASVTRGQTIGRSVQGRAITLVRRGPRDATRRILVVGCIHGNECAGIGVTRALRRVRLPTGVELLLVDSFNPDGRAHARRQNAHGVDLNRSFPTAWRRGGSPGDTYYPGPRALSEPESRAVCALVRQERPTVSIWFHQHARLVYLPAHGDTRLVRRYARGVGLPARAERPLLPGTATRWQNATFRHTTAFVVELPAGTMPASSVRRHAAAVMSAARGR